MQKLMVGMYVDAADARRAVHDLEAAKFPLDDVSVVMRERLASGFQGSSLLSGVIGNQASTAAMDMGRTSLPDPLAVPGSEAPHYGPLVAAGPLAQALGGAALGVAAGGLTGALGNLGVPLETAREIIERVRDGKGVIVAISVVPSEAERVEKLLLANNAAEVYRATRLMAPPAR